MVIPIACSLADSLSSLSSLGADLPASTNTFYHCDKHVAALSAPQPLTRCRFVYLAKPDGTHLMHRTISFAGANTYLRYLNPSSLVVKQCHNHVAMAFLIVFHTFNLGKFFHNSLIFLYCCIFSLRNKAIQTFPTNNRI